MKALTLQVSLTLPCTQLYHMTSYRYKSDDFLFQLYLLPFFSRGKPKRKKKNKTKEEVNSNYQSLLKVTLTLCRDQFSEVWCTNFCIRTIQKFFKLLFCFPKLVITFPTQTWCTLKSNQTTVYLKFYVKSQLSRSQDEPFGWDEINFWGVKDDWVKFQPVSWMSLHQVHLLQKPASNLLNKSLQKVQWKTTRYLVSWLILTSNSILKKNIIIILHLLNLYQIKIQIKIMVIMNNENFICVFECRIVNLATYRQFTNVAWDWIIQKKKKKRKDRKEKKWKLH